MLHPKASGQISFFFTSQVLVAPSISQPVAAWLPSLPPPSLPPSSLHLILVFVSHPLPIRTQANGDLEAKNIQCLLPVLRGMRGHGQEDSRRLHPQKEDVLSR